jgi:HK97 family phage portal protein
MSLLTRAASALGFSTRSKVLSIEDLAAKLDGGMGMAGLAAVSHQAALQVGTVFACARVLMDGVATPELNVYRQSTDGTRDLARDIPEQRLLNRRPNEWQTSFEFRRTMTLHLVLTGNALAVKVLGSDGRVRELIPIMPQHWQLHEVGRYDVEYRVYDRWGMIGVFAPDQVLHLSGPQWDGYEGLDAVKLARSAIGLSMAAESTQAALHANGGRPAGILTTDQPTSKDVVQKLRDYWKEFSARNRQGTAILDNGFKYMPLMMTGVDGQHLETRRFQVEEICRAMGVFPIMVGHSDKAATFASTEAFFGASERQTLRPLHTLWKQRLDEFVLDGAGPLFCEFDTRYLRQGSTKDRAVWARAMAELGIYTRNELRQEEGRDPLPGLDTPLTPMNMQASTGTGEDEASDPSDEEDDQP